MSFLKTMIGSAVVMLWTSVVAHAHPHVFVNAQAGFQIDAEQRLQALRISWRYDAFTTLFLFDVLDLDSDSDGLLNDADLATVATAETDWPPGYNGDVNLAVAGKPWQLSQPQNATASMIDGEIIVSFDLPLVNTVDMSAQRASLRLYDPAYYYAYSVTVDADSQNTDGLCEVIAIPFEPDEAAAETLWTLSTLSREETPDEPDIGARFADEILLTCD